MKPTNYSPSLYKVTRVTTTWLC